VTVTPIDTAFGVTCTGSPITGVVNILGLPVIDSVNTHSITCFGAADDTIWVYATSTNGPLSYSIDGGTTYTNTTGIFSGISAGTYNVYVKDDSSCSVGYALNPVRITQTAVALSATSVVTPVGCNGDSNGTINLLASGGAGGYLYNWSSGQNIEIISGLPAGIYTGTVTDANGCQASVSDTLINPTPVVTTITKTNVTCYGYGNGTAQISISGGVAPYQILWSNFDTTADITHLVTGLYRVRVTDSYGCEHSDSIRIHRPPLLTGTLAVTNVACFGTNIDSIVATLTGGNGGNTYTWSPSVSTDSIVANVAPGQYFVTVTDINGCTFVDSATITQPLTALYDTSIIISQVGCAGGTNGTIDILASGGSGGYTYNWSTGQTIQYISGLSAGVYICTVTDANGCTAATKSVLSNPAALTSAITATEPLCFGAANGTLTLSVNGGVPPYTLLWSNDDSSLTIGGISAGQYGVVITDSFGCQQIDTITVTQPTPLSATVVVTNIGCSGSTTGSVVVTVTGGTPGLGGYTYSWSSTGSTVDSVSGVGAGTYTVTITDANGCSITASGTVLQTGSPLIISAVVTNVTCNNDSNGAIDLNVSGGSGGYSYTWTSGQTTPFINGLPGGTYTVTVSSTGGCTGTLTETLSNPAPIVSSITGTNLTCYGAGNGSASLTITGGGVPPYNILWNNFDTSYSISGLAAGQYGVIITDSNGCRQIDTITLTQPSALSASVTVTNVSCNGGSNGSVVVTVTGGTPGIGGYTYSWSSTGSAVDSVSGVGPGTYTVTISDANGCNITASGTVTQPAALNAFTSVTNVSCNGGSTGSVLVTVTGGTAGYTYAWSSTGSIVDSISGVGPGTYTVTATDANGCTITASGTVNQPLSGIIVNQHITIVKCNSDSNGAIALTVYGGVGGYIYDWSTGQTTPSISGLPGGIYDVSVTDANGCVVTIADTLANPAAISDTIVNTNVHPCYGAHNGTATLTATGGTGVLTLLWSTGDTSFAITNLVGDRTYDVTITDANGCTHIDSIRIIRPTKLKDTISISNILCNGTNTDTLSVSASGSYQSGGYTYTWSPNVGSGALITGIPAGTYYLTVTDTAGCQSIDSAVITQPLNPLSVTGIVTQITCNNANNGSITVTASGGTPGYTYSWLGGQTTTTISNLAGGPYTVNVTDSNGCTASLTENIVNPSAISANIVGTNTSCAGGDNGTATLTVSGGTPGYTYLWSNFDTAQNLSNLTAGLYKVIITDANGCKGYDTILINQPNPIVAVVTVTNSGCTGGNTGSVVVSVSGGTPGVGGYTYSWSPVSSSTDSVSGIGPGTYTVTITDANGCSLIDSGTVIQPPSTLSAISIVTNITCNNSNNGEITVLPSGGSGGYTYSWTGTAQTTSTITGLGAGIYTVTVTDGNGCSTSLSDTLTNPTAITSTITGTNVTCAGANNGSASITSVTGGTLPYTFLWSNFANTQSVDSLSGGWYFVIISDANGCQNRDSIRITDPQPLVVTDSVSPVVCNNGTDGSIILTVTGGTGVDTYTWTPAGPNSPDNTGLAAGTYSVTVSDVNSCSSSLTVTLINPLTLTIANTVTDPKCNGDLNGSIDLIVIGGTPQYTYVWSPNVGNTANVNFLGAGTYLTTVTDAHGCQITDSIVVNQPAPMYVSGIQKNISCFDFNDGYILPTPYGGTQPYSFQWYLGADTFAPVGPVTENIINLAGGPYYLIVTDANGCMVPFTRTIINPDSLWVQLVDSSVTCFGASTGSVAVMDSGGTHPYQYLWNNFTTDSFQTGVPAGTYTVVVTDSNGCHKNQSIVVTQPQAITTLAQLTNVLCNGAGTGSIALTVSGGVPLYNFNWSTTPVQTTSDATGLTAGSYAVTIGDANGCSVTELYTLTQPDSIAINTAVNDPTCSGGDNGFISLDVRGGTAPYGYNWSTTPVQTGNVASGLGAGTYYATVTDNNGCTVLDSGVVVSPLPITVVVAPGSSACSGGGVGGVVIVTASGGLSPYTYGIGDIIQGTDTFTGLSVGTYTVAVTDANGCVGTDPVTVAPLGTFADTLTSNPIIVLAGEPVILYAHATSDTTITSYNWFPSDSLTFPCGTPNCDSAEGMPTQTQYYIVTVTNARGCTITDTILVKVSNTASAFVPSAFTPNNDGLNDFFTMDILGATTIDVQVWDRWGEKVFSNPSQANGINAPGAWDGTFRGKPVQFDTYTYQLVVTYYDGHTETIAGTVVVMK
jgi:gliding motility-associated-like protein